ncbi:ubiquitin carboxyl-terminal hydrolase 47 isoform X1 [Hydra vulgaris]|uniref:ubiquitin carboxyl-terminal hydrolase 47 isoform X1 n=1 Tax=Hydra vulgaris TaxID=6087 RepID=UPI001F5F70D1|nr:ubiquitin carboxyl-terminal hydrolase 47 isoform X1 [Hydra vulgaris]XP_047125680.1 ubiquitin carboxyl-terminal hydrolase 47 isoform X1 [Hydra vulgaris]
MIELQMIEENSRNQKMFSCIFCCEFKEFSKVSMDVDGNTQINEFYKMVAFKHKLENGTFQISYLTENIEKILIEDCTDTISYFLSDNNKAYEFFIKSKDGSYPLKTKKTTDAVEKNGKAKSDQFGSLYNSSNSLKSDTGFVGLINQAMTCYLNSLLQTLFMTPEFRNALYKCNYEGLIANSVANIPFQLQKLFLQLETSHKRAVETTELTKSFGWDSNEAWQQHDVQELCRVLFDALEESLKGTEQKDLIKELYQGELEDYVKCQKCDHKNLRKDFYLDISVDMKPFGSDKSYESLEEALKAFVKPEVLNGNNQYYCEHCKSKQDAHKGLKFVSFPYLLTIQLKRFTFNFKTLQRMKIHDRMTFPFQLDLSELLKSTEEDNFDLKKKEEINDLSMKSSLKENETLNGCQAKENERVNGFQAEVNEKSFNHLNNEISDSQFLCEKERLNHIQIEDTCSKNELTYELFSVLIHSGSTLGGHYYAYIKSFKNKKWYCFNDQYVSEISESEIEKSYGGDNKHGGYYSSSSNAYMLMYRKIDKKNKTFMKKQDWPVYLRKLCSSLHSDINKVDAEKFFCKIKLYGFHPINGNKVEALLEVFKDETLKNVTEKAWKILNFHEYLPLCQCRLIKYDDNFNSIVMSFDEQETSMVKLLGGFSKIFSFDLLLEWRKESEQFQVYEPGGVTLKVYVDDKLGDFFEEPFLLYVSSNSTIGELKNIISLRRGCEFSKLVVYKEHRGFLLLDNPEKTLKMESFYKYDMIFVTDTFTEDYKTSSFYKKLEEFTDTIKLFIVQTKKENSEELTLNINKKKTFGYLKKKIEDLINVEQHLFRIYRISFDQEYECIRLEDTLSTMNNGAKIIVKLGRALMTGESRVKVYLFEPNNEDPMTFFMEAVAYKGLTIGEFKKQIFLELNRVGKDHPIERIRVRRKASKNPCRIYTNNDRFEVEVKLTDLLVELLQENDIIVNDDYLNLYAKRWRPSQLLLCPFEEIILYKDTSLVNLKKKLSEKSGIPLNQVSIAKGRGVFPCMVSILDIYNELEWDCNCQKLGEYPISITDDGSVIYYRDNKEEIKELTFDERREIRLSERKQYHPFQHSKEKSLKIYANGVKN